MNLAERKRKRRHFKRRYDTEMKVNKKSKSDLFLNRIHARLRKNLEKGAIKMKRKLNMKFNE